MKIPLKTKADIDIMREGGKITSAALCAVKAAVRPGITPLELDRIAEAAIKEMGGEASFKRVPGYKYTICSCLNDIVVHGIPQSEPLVVGDRMGIDVGAYYKGFHTDVSYSVLVTESGYWEPNEGDMKAVTGEKQRVSDVANPTMEERKMFLTVGKRALIESIEQAVVGNHIGDISYVLQTYLECAGYGVVKELIGHGVGKDLHEPPQVPGRGKPGEGIILKEGMVLAIEAIYSLGKPGVAYKDNDGWSIATADFSLSGLYEASVAIKVGGPEVLTLW
ncbi:MAG: M24 family metallopeptidase [bacterium]|nr:M24 family metallopeptidase [bacterium]